jgi:hypothetical protein
LGKYYSVAEPNSDAIAESIGNIDNIACACRIDIAYAIGFGDVRVSVGESEAEPIISLVRPVSPRKPESGHNPSFERIALMDRETVDSR